MDEKLFYRIIDELHEIGFLGRFSPHFYGEPLLDKRIIKFIAYTRNKLPRVLIKLFTNGDMLTYELYKKLIAAGVDVFRIAQHDERPSDTILEVFHRIGKKDLARYVEYVKYFDNDKICMNRGGLIEVRHDTKMSFCNYVSGITIDYKGNMLLCCQDYESRYNFGNLNKENILDIWNKKHYKDIRNKLRAGIWSLDICRVCNGS